MEAKVKWYNDLQMVGTLVFFFRQSGSTESTKVRLLNPYGKKSHSECF